MSRIINYCLLFSLTLVMFATTVVNGQELKYKDVFEAVKSQNEETAYELLRRYQEQDPFSANVYYQLGIISQQWAKKYDPLTDYNNVSYFLYHADLYYSICLKYLDEKEVHRNDDYYQQAKIPEGQKRLEYNDVLNDVNEKISAVKDYKNHVELIRKYYFGAVSNYNQSLQSFLDLNIKNNKLKDIYLTADKELLQKISDIGVHFDSTLLYFNQYQGAVTEFPIGDYNQKYTLLPIETYRLQGLTESDFLQNQVDLWNYRSWVDTVQAIINTDVKTLRKEILTEGKKENELVSRYLNYDGYSDTLNHYSLDEKLGYRIGRFDYQPIIWNLFQYNQAKINLLIDSKNPVNNPLNDSDYAIPFFKRLTIYSQIVTQKQKADDALRTLKEQTTEYKVNKYLDFISQNYENYTGFNKFIDSEPKELNILLDSSMNHLKQAVRKEMLKADSNRQVIIYKKAQIPMAISMFPNQVEPDKYYTSAYLQNEIGDYYLTGFIKTENKNLKAFVLRADSTLKAVWLKTYDFSSKEKMENMGMQIALTDQGCIVMIQTRSELSDLAGVKNYLVRLSADGKELYKKEINETKVPRFMSFDAINEKLLMAFGGTLLNFAEPISDTLDIVYADSAGSSVWSTRIGLQGSLVNIIRSNEKFVVVGNYHLLNDGQQDYQSQNGGYSVFLMILDGSGKIEATKVYSVNEPCQLAFAVKLNSETFSLIGFKSMNFNIGKKPDLNSASIFYRLVDPKGDIKFSY